MKDEPSAKRVTPITELSAPSPDLEETIRIRAYKLYEQRGRTDGHSEEDWLEAESEIKAGKGESAAA
jgi:hypothetical protein